MTIREALLAWITECEQRYKSLFEYNPNTICIFDLQGNFVSGNEKVIGLTGYTIDELKHKHFEHCVVPEDRDRAHELFQKATQGEVQEYNTAIYDRSGQRKEIRVITVPICVNKQIIGGCSIVTDITEEKKMSGSLQESEERYRHLVELSPEPILVHIGGIVAYANQAAIKALGASTDREVLGRNVLEFVHPDHREYVIQRMKYMCEVGNAVDLMEEKVIRLDGTIAFMEVVGAGIVYQGKPAVQLIFRDVTDRKRMEQRLRESEEKYRLIADNMTDLVSVLDTNGIVLYASPSHEKVLGTPTDSLIGQAMFESVHPDDLALVQAKLKQMITTKQPTSVEFRYKHKDGYYIWFEAKETPILNNNHEITRIIVASRDITERKRYEEKLQNLAFYDSLTGVPNRRLLQEDIRKILARTRRNQQMFAVLFIDGDRFKFINDTMGHDVGDEFLKAFTKRVKTCMRESDELYRLGGDEFVVILSDIQEPKEAAQVSKRILTALQKPWKIRGHEFTVTSSIGIALYPSDGEDEATLLKHADMALYHAKKSGKNMYKFYNALIGESSEEQLTMETALQTALEKDEFVLYYQPQMDLITGQITGAEALIRWHHPALGMISPDRFMPRAELNGMIYGITRWVLRTACLQSQEWKQQGLPSKVAVNVSPKHLHRKDLVEVVATVIQETGISPSDLELEITENAIIKDMELAADTISRLKEIGVRVAIDDFGRGFASLSYLKTLPLDTLKIDRFFIQDLCTNERDNIIVDFIINLAQMLNLQVIAEGVEREEQINVLKQKHCHMVQGYYVSRPVPREAYVQLVKSRLATVYC